MNSFFHYHFQVCNSSHPSLFLLKREYFYPLKKKLLERYGRPDGWQRQTITRICYACDGCGELWGNPCDSCDGTGIYSQSVYYLQRWQLGDRVYHTPCSSSTEMQGDEKDSINGKICHWPVPGSNHYASLAILLIRFDPIVFIHGVYSRFCKTLLKILRKLVGRKPNYDEIPF